MGYNYNKNYKNRTKSYGGFKEMSGGPTSEEKAYARFADMMIEKISKMEKSNWQQPWVTDSIGLPRNIDGRRYNSLNSIMLMMLCEREHYDLPVFATFDRITRLNGQKSPKGLTAATDEQGNPRPVVKVTAGQHGFPVFLTILNVYHRVTDEKIDYDDYKELSEEEQKDYKVVPKSKVYYVYNIAAQTNIEEARPELLERIRMQNAPKVRQASAEERSSPLNR